VRAVLRSWPLLLIGGFALAAIAFILPTGCVASAGAYVGDYDYYGAPGYVVYDGWGPTYRVGPPRDDHDHHDVHHDDHHDNHGSDGHAGHTAYKPAPPSRAVPSIPTQSRPPARAPGKN
jgi:hypothetical protein